MKKSVHPINLHEELIKECRLGNRKSQFELYKLYYKAMFNTTIRIVGDYSEAEDVMQDSFLKAFQNIHKYKGEVSFGAWLKKIVVNHSLDQLRKRKIEFVAIEDESDFDQVEENEDDKGIEDNISVAEVINEINKLPDGYKIVLTLYLLEGYDHEEISEILKISQSTSRSQFIRAKKRLIENFDKRKKGK
jgi:RNA polymerase sigma factor (sigma-70 family)